MSASSNLYQAGVRANNNTAATTTTPTTTTGGAEEDDAVNPDLVTFPSSRPGHSVTAGHELFAARQAGAATATANGRQQPVTLMGPILRRQKVVSLPLGAGGDFFYTTTSNNNDEMGPHHYHHYSNQQSSSGRERRSSYDPNRRQKQRSHDATTTNSTISNGVVPPAAAPPSPRSNAAATTRGRRQRQTTPNFMQNILRRRQISLDLLGPNDFFGVPDDGDDGDMPVSGATSLLLLEEDDDDDEGGSEGDAAAANNNIPATLMEEEEDGDDDVDHINNNKKKDDAGVPSISSLFFPLRFAPRQKLRSGGGGHGGGGGGGPAPSNSSEDNGDMVDPETQERLERYVASHKELKADMLRLSTTSMNAIPEETSAQLSELCHKMERMSDDVDCHSSAIKSSSSFPHDDDGNDDDDGIKEQEEQEADMLIVQAEPEENDEDDPTIIRAGRSDKIRAGLCFVVMLALTLIITLWETHLDNNVFILGPVGLACVTDCPGNIETRDFFFGHYHFEPKEVIDLVMNLDANSLAEEVEAHALVEIVGVETGLVKASHEFGPPGEERRHYNHKILVDFDDPHEAHIIVVNSTDPNVQLSFTLLADAQKPISDYSVIVAAIIMVVVYTFILLEVIHRTLIAIFGSMVALMFLFIMEGGHVESIKIIMLHLEWSTLGLLFGMMLIVGELSHTGVFEWCAVRILIYSKGSYVRLLVLLSALTAVASAFLDNVTTMLLVAPVTIDMCHIVGDIDPRPYLIAEVLLSNVGGTATLIGDPPNIIIGSAFSDIIGFMDFIVHVLPVIFAFCIPATLLLVVYLYRWYLTSSKMRVLDTALLKKTYRIYDEPRLLISGIVTAFVILLFFLHPVHHKDTAWVALLGAFVTVAFTNPHDIQSALRNHVEWDTLLFFAGLFILVEVCAAMGLLQAIGDMLASYIESQEEDMQLTVAITLILWVSAFASSFLDNIPYTATMIPVMQILSEKLPDTLPLQTLAWALSLGACLGGNGTLLGASANIVTAGISTNKGYEISFVNFLYPGMLTMIVTVAISNVYMLVRYVWAA